MAPIRKPPVLLGREHEQALLDQLLEGTRAHKRGGVLLLRGEAGIGKTALLEYVVERSAGCRVVRAAGIQAEMELAYAGLQQVCGPLVDGLDRLPPPQREAIRVAFGLALGPSPDRFLVGLGVLGLLSIAAASQPVVCVIDDAHWLDRASLQVMGFVARRLGAENFAMVFAVRERTDYRDLAGLPELVLERLNDTDARALLTQVLVGRVDEHVIARVISETRGNPLAIVELPRGLAVADLAGGFRISASVPLSARIEESFLNRVRLLPEATQRLLLLAAAEPVGDPLLLWRAAARLDLDLRAANPAEACGLLELGDVVRFRHPLVRSAVYAAATLKDRQQVHRALAEITDPHVDPDRHAWHRAHATQTPDEDVANELEQSATRAMARGGMAAAAAFLERAATLSADTHSRARRSFAAARMHEQAGSPSEALSLLAAAEAWQLDELERATLHKLRAQVAVHLRGGAEASRQLLEAAIRLESADIHAARETYLEAMYAATVLERPGSYVTDVAHAVLAARRHPLPQPAIDLLLEGLAVRFTDGVPAAAPVLKQALTELLHQDTAAHDDLRARWLSLALRTAADLFDNETWHQLATRQIQRADDTGGLSVLPMALVHLAHLRIFTGEFDAAVELMHKAETITDATGNGHTAGNLKFLVAAYQDGLGAPVLLETALRDAARGTGWAPPAYMDYASAVLHNGLGRYEVAMQAAQRSSSAGHLSHSTWALPELVEAAARCGNMEVASVALARLSEHAFASGTEWALGLQARSRAMLTEGGKADQLFGEAIEWLARTSVRVELARARLLYGEWLRRERRRIDARQQLRIAYELFSDVGAEVFAERARRELVATGERARRRIVETRGELTAQERQIASMACDGHSNQEIGSRLFISPKTVEYHLHSVFGKLGISSRYQLERVFRRDELRIRD